MSPMELSEDARRRALEICKLIEPYSDCADNMGMCGVCTPENCYIFELLQIGRDSVPTAAKKGGGETL